MLGISADRLFGEELPARTHYFAFAAFILIATMAAALWFRRRNGGRKAEDVQLNPFIHSPIRQFCHPRAAVRRLRNVGVKSRCPAISSGSPAILKRSVRLLYCRSIGFKNYFRYCSPRRLLRIRSPVFSDESVISVRRGHICRRHSIKGPRRSPPPILFALRPRSILSTEPLPRLCSKMSP